MTLFVTLDGKAVDDIATNSGWRDFSKFAAGVKDSDALNHLATNGWSDKLDELQDELANAIESANPNANQKSIAGELLKIIKSRGSAEVLVVSDGTGEGEETELSESWFDRVSENCGTGAGGFQQGNDCAKGGDSITSMTRTEFESEIWFHAQEKDSKHFGEQVVHGGITKDWREALKFSGITSGKSGGEVRLVRQSEISKLISDKTIPQRTRARLRRGLRGGIIDSLRDTPIKSEKLTIPATVLDPFKYVQSKAPKSTNESTWFDRVANLALRD